MVEQLGAEPFHIEGARIGGRDDGHDAFVAGGGIFRHSEDEAGGDPGNGCGGAFNGFRGDFATGDIDQIAGSSQQGDSGRGHLDEIMGVIPSMAQVERVGRKIAESDRGASYFKATVRGDRHIDSLHGETRPGVAGARGGAAVVGDTAALGGSIEIVNLELVTLEDGRFERERERSAGGDGETDMGGDGARFEPAAPKDRNGGERNLGSRSAGAADGFREVALGQDEGNAVEQERKHEVGKAVGVGQRDDPDVGPIRAETHGGHDLVGVGGELGA